MSPLRATIRSKHGDSWPQELDEMPPRASNREYVVVGADVSHQLCCCVVLEEQVHVRSNPTDILEHRGILHVGRIGTVTVKAAPCQYTKDVFCKACVNSHVMVIDLQNVGDLSERLAQEWLIEVACVEVKVSM